MGVRRRLQRAGFVFCVRRPGEVAPPLPRPPCPFFSTPFASAGLLCAPSFLQTARETRRRAPLVFYYTPRLVRALLFVLIAPRRRFQLVSRRRLLHRLSRADAATLIASRPLGCLPTGRAGPRAQKQASSTPPSAETKMQTTTRHRPLALFPQPPSPSAPPPARSTAAKLAS